MRYTVYDLIIDVKRKIHGGSIPNTIQAALDEGRRSMIGKIKPYEMQRKSYIEQALYDQVDRYAIPEDVKYSDIIDINELSCYRDVDTLWRPLAQLYNRQFNAKARENVFSIGWNSGVKTMGIFRPKGLHKYRHLKINEMDSLSENGTWNTGGNVVNMRLDEMNKISKKASLSFDINDSSSSGFIQNFSMTPVDISDYLSIGAAFLWTYISIPTEMISIKLTLGSNVSNLATDYYYATVNQPHDSNEFVTGWNLMKYLLKNMTAVGTPNLKSIAFMRIDFTTTGKVIPNCNLDACIVRKGYIYEMNYNSSYCLIDPLTRAWKKLTTKNSDQFPFEEDTYQILMLETALIVQKDLYANSFGAGSDVTGIETELAYKYQEYRKKHKEEFIEPEQFTNTMGRQAYGYGMGRGTTRHHHRPENWFEEDSNNLGM